MTRLPSVPNLAQAPALPEVPEDQMVLPVASAESTRLPSACIVRRTLLEVSDVPEGITEPPDRVTVEPVFFTTVEVVWPTALVKEAVERPPAGAVVSTSSAPG
jgi:hypothetical protein